MKDNAPAQFCCNMTDPRSRQLFLPLPAGSDNGPIDYIAGMFNCCYTQFIQNRARNLRNVSAIVLGISTCLTRPVGRDDFLLQTADGQNPTRMVISPVMARS